MNRRSFFLATALSLAAILMAGCAVDQKKEVAIYRDALAEGVSHQLASQFDPSQPLSLRDALLLANENNENLGLSGEDFLQALIDKDRAAAAFLPTISFVPTYFVQDHTSNNSSSSSNSNNSRNTRLDTPIVGNANLFNGFRDVANLRRAAFTIEQRRNALLDFQQSLLLDAARAYYAVLTAERSVVVLKNSLSVQDERVRDIRGRQQAGVARPLDVAQIEAQASATRVTLLQAERDVQNAREALRFLIGVPVENTPLVDEYPLDQQPRDAATILEFAQSHRRDLLAAREASLAARQAVEAAVGQYYPSIALNVNYFLSRQTSPTDSEWNALFTANLPIFSAGLIEADVRTAWSRYRQAKLDESLIGRQIEQDIRTAHQNLLSSDAQLNELQTQLSAAKEAFRQAEESYKVGLATNLERVTSQDRLLSAQLQLTQEQFNRKVLYLTLLRAGGETFANAEREYRERVATQPTTSPTEIPVTQPKTK